MLYAGVAVALAIVASCADSLCGHASILGQIPSHLLNPHLIFQLPPSQPIPSEQWRPSCAAQRSRRAEPTHQSRRMLELARRRPQIDLFYCKRKALLPPASQVCALRICMSYAKYSTALKSNLTVMPCRRQCLAHALADSQCTVFAVCTRCQACDLSLGGNSPKLRQGMISQVQVGLP